jgi:hypothetical protein
VQFKKLWGPGNTLIEVVPAGSREFPTEDVTIQVALKHYGYAGIATLPYKAPPPALGNSVPSSSGAPTPMVTRVVPVRSMSDLLVPPPEFLRTPIKNTKPFSIDIGSLLPSPEWLEVSMTAAQSPIYSKCVEGLMELVGWTGFVELMPRTMGGEGEKDLRVVVCKSEGCPHRVYPCELKRSDSAGQATFNKAPWQVEAKVTSSPVAEWTDTSKKIVRQVSTTGIPHWAELQVD